MSGKERALEGGAPDQHEAPETAVAADDARWLNGVSRQLRADAPAQRAAASKAAAAKRTAGAMSAEQRAEKRQADQRRRRARRPAEKQQQRRSEEADACAEPVLPADDAPYDEWFSFYREVLREEHGRSPTHDEVEEHLIDHKMFDDAWWLACAPPPAEGGEALWRATLLSDGPTEAASRLEAATAAVMAAASSCRAATAAAASQRPAAAATAAAAMSLRSTLARSCCAC